MPTIKKFRKANCEFCREEYESKLQNRLLGRWTRYCPRCVELKVWVQAGGRIKRKKEMGGEK